MEGNKLDANNLDWPAMQALRVTMAHTGFKKEQLNLI